MRHSANKFWVSLVLLFSIGIGLFSVPWVSHHSYAEGEQGRDRTDHLDIRVEVRHAESLGGAFELLDRSAVNWLQEEEYLRFTYLVHKNTEVGGIEENDFARIPISDVFRQLSRSELESLQSELQTDRFRASFDDLDAPTELILRFLKKVPGEVEYDFSVTLSLRFSFVGKSLDQPWNLNVPIKSGDAVSKDQYALALDFAGLGVDPITITGERDRHNADIVWVVDANRNFVATASQFEIHLPTVPGVIFDAKDVIVQELLPSLQADHSIEWAVNGELSRSDALQPAASEFSLETQSDRLVIRLAADESEGRRRAYRITIRSQEDGIATESWLPKVYKLSAEQRIADHMPQASAPARVEVESEPMVSVTSAASAVDRAEHIDWTATLNPHRRPMERAVYRSEVINERDAERAMTFRSGEIRAIQVVDGIEKEIPLSEDGNASGSRLEIAQDGRSFRIFFADEDISKQVVRVESTSRIDPSYRRWISTDSSRLVTEVRYRNDASLEYDRIPAGTVHRASHGHSLSHGNHIVKKFEQGDVYGNEKTIVWSYYYNLSGLATQTVELGDEIDPSNQSLYLLEDGSIDLAKIEVQIGDADSIWLNPSSHDYEWRNGRVLRYGVDYTVEKRGEHGFVVLFDARHRPLSVPVRVLFTTKLNENYAEGQPVANTAIVDGERYRFEQFGESFRQYFGKLSDGIDFRAQEISYVLNANPSLVPLENFKMIDRLAEGQVFYGRQLKEMMESGVTRWAYIDGVKVMTKRFVEEQDFALYALPLGKPEYDLSLFERVRPDSIDPSATYRAFMLQFTNPADHGEYFAKVKASFDPDWRPNHLQNAPEGWFNHAQYLWTGSGDGEWRRALAPYPMQDPEMYRDNAKLAGNLDASARTLRWTLDANVLSRRIERPEWTIGVSEGQQLIAGSIRLFVDTVEAQEGGLVLRTTGTELDPLALGVAIEVDANGKQFHVRFPENGPALNRPLRIVYETQIDSLKQASFDSVATLVTRMGGSASHLQTVEGSVVPSAETPTLRIRKQGAVSNVSPVTEWTLDINESKNTLDDLTIADRFSPGLDPMPHSFELLDRDGQVIASGARFLEWFDYEAPQGSSDVERTFRLVFRGSRAPHPQITDRMTIRYRMAIHRATVSDKMVTNTVSMKSGTEHYQADPVKLAIPDRYVGGSAGDQGFNRRLQIQTRAEDGRALSGVHLRVERLDRNGSPATVAVVTSDAEGSAILEHLQRDTVYRVTEISNGSGLERVSPKEQEIRITDAHNAVNGGTPAQIHFVYRIVVAPPTSPVDPETSTEGDREPTPSPSQETTVAPAPETTKPESGSEAPTDSSSTPESTPEATSTTQENSVRYDPESDRASGNIAVEESDTVVVSEQPNNGTLILHEGGDWEYIPLGVPTKDRFVVTVIKPNGVRSEVLIEIDPETVPLATLPLTGQYPDALFYGLGAGLLLLGVAIRKLSMEKFR